MARNTPDQPVPQGEYFNRWGDSTSQTQEEVDVGFEMKWATVAQDVIDRKRAGLPTVGSRGMDPVAPEVRTSE